MDEPKRYFDSFPHLSQSEIDNIKRNYSEGRELETVHDTYFGSYCGYLNGQRCFSSMSERAHSFLMFEAQNIITKLRTEELAGSEDKFFNMLRKRSQVED